MTQHTSLDGAMGIVALSLSLKCSMILKLGKENKVLDRFSILVFCILKDQTNQIFVLFFSQTNRQKRKKYHKVIQSVNRRERRNTGNI